jgi:NAD(P)-dependent dehydrogenase (short-subunit alcohol dehydrogenase family)
MPSAIVVAASSDIGFALSMRWKSRNWQVAGTFRNASQNVVDLKTSGVSMVKCDLMDPSEVAEATRQLVHLIKEWDVLALCPGTLEPVGPFSDIAFSDWAASIQVNLVAPLRMIHALLPHRSVEASPTVVLFAGAGTNSAPPNYSSYVTSKIGLIKMCELLDAEIPDVRFTIIGPGWVPTKIHQATLRSVESAGENYSSTVNHLESDGSTALTRVLDCCDWVISAQRSEVGGRNFSVVNDSWGIEDLSQQLEADSDMYKLRRAGNDWRISTES